MQQLARSYFYSALQTRLVVGVCAAVLLNGVYCLAYRYAAGNPATLFDAFSWGVINIAPWITAVEIGRSQSRSLHILFLLFAAGLSSLLIEMLVDLDMPTLFDVIRRLPGVLVAIAALGVFAIAERKTKRAKDKAKTEALTISCDWARSAGNYVELHIQGADPKLVRATLARVTDENQPQLVRIHRRYSVYPKAIERLERTHVLLRDGSRLPIGDRYRSRLFKLERLVPTSQRH